MDMFLRNIKVSFWSTTLQKLGVLRLEQILEIKTQFGIGSDYSLKTVNQFGDSTVLDNWYWWIAASFLNSLQTFYLHFRALRTPVRPFLQHLLTLNFAKFRVLVLQGQGDSVQKEITPSRTRPKVDEFVVFREYYRCFFEKTQILCFPKIPRIIPKFQEASNISNWKPWNSNRNSGKS